jgi:hypothetical protein
MRENVEGNLFTIRIDTHIGTTTGEYNICEVRQWNRLGYGTRQHHTNARNGTSTLSSFEEIKYTSMT